MEKQNEWPKKVSEQKPKPGQKIIIYRQIRTTNGKIRFKPKDGDHVNYWTIDESCRVAVAEHGCGGVILIPDLYWEPYIEPPKVL